MALSHHNLTTDAYYPSTLTDTYYTDNLISNKHFTGHVPEEALRLPDDASLQIGSDFRITASELKQLLNYLKSIHPEAFI